MKDKNKKLSQLKLFQDIPHILQNLPVPIKKDLKTIKEYQDLIQSVKSQLGPSGKVFVRFLEQNHLLEYHYKAGLKKNYSFMRIKSQSVLKKNLHHDFIGKVFIILTWSFSALL